MQHHDTSRMSDLNCKIDRVDALVYFLLYECLLVAYHEIHSTQQILCKASL